LISAGRHPRAAAGGIGIAERPVEIVNLTGHRLLAGIGGGPGTCSTFLLKRYPELSDLFGLQMPLTYATGGAHDAHDVS
jgi:hypothetical protein